MLIFRWNAGDGVGTFENFIHSLANTLADVSDSTLLPSRDEMIRAYLDRDVRFEGIFLTAVRTTGIFCRPDCPARKPKPENVEFFATAKEALDHGFRPCKRCRPMRPKGASPEWLQPLIDALESDPLKRWRDGDLRSMGLDPERVRRWFKDNHGMTFHAYSRSRRLGDALGTMKSGAPLASAAFDHGFESVSGFRSAIERITGVPAGTAPDKGLLYLHRLTTPLGPMLAGATETAICLLEFIDRPMLPTQLTRIRKRFEETPVPQTNALIDTLALQLEEYFGGTRTEFDIPLDLRGTPFQEDVWQVLLNVPYGRTASYADLAKEIGNPGAVRAVARANGDNRMAILIPCHRIIGSDGSLTGYGGGLHRKRFLLELEKGIRSPGLFDSV